MVPAAGAPAAGVPVPTRSMVPVATRAVRVPLADRGLTSAAASGGGASRIAWKTELAPCSGGKGVARTTMVRSNDFDPGSAGDAAATGPVGKGAAGETGPVGKGADAETGPVGKWAAGP